MGPWAKVWLLLACFAKLGVAQTEDPREALAADDACAAGSCSLGLLQAWGLKSTHMPTSAPACEGLGFSVHAFEVAVVVAF